MPGFKLSMSSGITCTNCERFQRQYSTLSSRSQQAARDPFLLHSNFAELEACATKGCYICRVVRTALLRECFSREYEVLRSSPHPVSTTFPGVVRRLNEQFNAFHDEGTAFFTEVKISDIFALKAQIWLTTVSEKDKTNSFEAKAPHAADTAVFKQAARWLQTCAAEHFYCTERMEIGAPPHNPSRLVHIGTSGSSNIKLIESPTKLIMYCALSYCWGDGGSLRTTPENISKHMEGIPFSSFSGTLRDAINVSRKLGIQYIWIDALCIIQDDTDDFALESVRMHKVYGHAIVTLSICTSKSATESFLIPREAETLRLSESFTFAGKHLALTGKTLEDVRERSPLTTRAWTFQEELLSPRNLYWSDHGIFWSCSRAQWSENNSKDMPPRSHDNKDWNGIIEAYSRRELSNENDRLTALSGIASKWTPPAPPMPGSYANLYRGNLSHHKVGASPNDEYVAGLWQSTLPGSLLWTIQESPKPAKLTERDFPVSYIAPSWSWASLPGGQPIKAAADGRTENCLLKNKTIKLKRRADGLPDAHGPLDYASITLEGDIRPLFLSASRLIDWPKAVIGEDKETKYPSLFRSEATHSIIENSQQVMVSPGRHKWVVFKVDRSLIPLPEDLECLQIGDGFLVLQKIVKERTEVESGPSTTEKTLYRRIGCGTFNKCPDFFESAVKREVTIV